MTQLHTIPTNAPDYSGMSRSQTGPSLNLSTSGDKDKLAVATYVQEMACSLNDLSNRADLQMLAYLLDLVREEALIIIENEQESDEDS